MLAFDRGARAVQQQVLVGCAWMAAGAVGAGWLCGNGRHHISATRALDVPVVGSATHVRDHELLRCASFFLLVRTGRSPSGEKVLHDEMSSILAPDVQAYGASGRDQVQVVLRKKARARSFHHTVLSVTASTVDTSVHVRYHDGSAETIYCTRGPDQQTLVQQVLIDREPAVSGALDRASSPCASAGVELLWWAMRFLHADISRDYAAQRRYLAPDASAFGAVGREAVLAANGEDLPEEQKSVYTVPYPITVDADNGARP